MNIKKALHTETGKKIISIILGLGLATLFRKACHDRTCLEFKAVTKKDIQNKIYKFNNKCYSFKEKSVSCNANKKILSL